MFCPTCHKEFAGDVNFCTACGSPLARECSRCHASVKEGYGFCPSCGAPLADVLGKTSSGETPFADLKSEPAVSSDPQISAVPLKVAGMDASAKSGTASNRGIPHFGEPDVTLTATDVSATTCSTAANRVFPTGALSTGVSGTLQGGTVAFETNTWKRLGLFVLVNAAVVATMAILVQAFAFIAPIIATAGAFLALLLSRWLAQRAHKIKMILPGHFASDDERRVYQLVEDLSKKAGLPVTPQVGIYKSDDMNAFATGMTKKRSMIAFSTALLQNMDSEAVAAVAAHETAHIANGDMITLCLVQAVVNTVVLAITIPLSLIKVFAFFSDDVDVLTYWIISAVKFLITITLTLLGSLVVMAFSRHREFRADEGSARLVSAESMIHALNVLRTDECVAPKEQASYAALKISSPKRWLDIFSTHPSLERRIAALEAFGGGSSMK